MVNKIDKLQAFWVAVLTGWNYKRFCHLDFRMCPLAVLMGDCINRVFFYKEMYGHFAGPKKLAVI